ncbi:MAG TPA: hypothetical protein VHW67_07030 [Solirubrobacteraceae bacterium]|jgi:hypothetical protein|nr:hypothetical protein [Solirubrobacteraceae bacterium]
MKAVRKWQGLATLGAVLSLAIGALALTPTASLAATHACGSHTVVIEFESEPGKPKTKYKLQVKQIVTSGVSCASAFKFLNGLYTTTSGKTPEGYSCKVVKFKVPVGSIPESCTKSGGKKIQFAGKGG